MSELEIASSIRRRALYCLYLIYIQSPHCYSNAEGFTRYLRSNDKLMSDERNPFDSFIDEPDAIEAVYENLRYLDNLGYVETITDVNGEKICAVRITKKGIVFVEGSLDFNIEAPAFQVDIGEINIISVEDFTLSLKREIEKAGMSEDRKKELLDRLDDITSHPTYNTALSTILSRLPLSPDCT